mgnify:CR=1 FL=1
MQVLRQALSFVQRGERLRAFVQFGIDHRDRGLVGHGQGQVGVMSRKVVPLGVRDAEGSGQLNSQLRLPPLERRDSACDVAIK